VAAFKKAREVKVGNFKTYTFHAEFFKPHRKVGWWLSDLETQDAVTDTMCFQLVRAMLAIDPKARPTAQQVTSRLRLIAMTAPIGLMYELFNKLLQVARSIEADIERGRFNGWKVVFESITSNDDPWNCMADTRFNFDSILECPMKTREVIQSILARYSHALSSLCLKLRALVDQLLNFLHPSPKMSANAPGT
jgi:hypothetical protein